MILIDQNKCIGCGDCVEDCVSRALVLRESKAVYEGRCITCGHCVAVCPSRAVSIPEYEMNQVEPLDLFPPIPPDQLLHTIKSRRSIRQFQDRSVEPEILEQILQAGGYTATASNAQGCRFIVVQDQLSQLKEKVWGQIETQIRQGDGLSEELKVPFEQFLTMRSQQGTDYLFRNAPAVLYIAADYPLDAGLAAQNMELMAVANGLGILYNGFLLRATLAFPEISQWLGTGDKKLAISMLLGYPSVTYQRTAPRRKIDKILL